MNNKLMRTGSWCFYLAVFLNAFVDLGHKIIIQNTIFKLYSGSFQVILTALVNAMILLPFIFLLSPAGYLSDRYAKIQVMRYSAWAVVGACAVIVLCYYLGWFVLAFVMTLLLAVQAAIFSPAKYGFIKEYFGKDKLGEINGIVSALSIAAILAGTFAFSIGFELYFVNNEQSPGAVLRAIAPIGWLLLISSAVELFVVYQIPLAGLSAPQVSRATLGASKHWTQHLTPRHMWRDVQPLLESRAIRLSAIGLSIFWAIGQVMLAAFPSFLKDEMNVTNTIVVQGILACAGIGIAIGSVFAGRFSRNYIETGLLPIGAFGLAVGLLLLPGVDSQIGAGLMFLFIGVMGGIFIVPLNALIQYFAKADAMGHTLAASNWLQNLTMLLFLLITVVSSLLALSSSALLFVLGLVALAGSVYTVWELPQSLTRFILSRIVSTRYRIKVQGMKHIPAYGGVLLLGNHLSWIDWAIIQIASPRPVRFVMTHSVFNLWYLTWFFKLFGTISIELGASSRNALDQAKEALRRGEVVCLFPEGTISRNGQLAEFKRGYEHVCAEVDSSVVIIPFFLRGLWGSQFSRSSERLKRNTRTLLSREVVVDFGIPLDKGIKVDALKQKVLELSLASWHEYAENLPTLGEQWINSCAKAGNHVVLLDTMGARMNAKTALTGSIILSRRIRHLSQERNVGILLPGSSASALVNLACMLLGKTAVNLNFTTSSESLLSGLRQAQIRTIYTSHRFVEKLKGRGFDIEALQQQCKLVILEDFRAQTSKLEKILTLLSCYLLPASVLKNLYCARYTNEETAVILFSSGSEGEPKGVMLSHRSLMTNVKQVTEVLNLEDGDVILANLPPFHAFGLTVTLFMPMLEQVPVVFHPDPTDVYGTAMAIAEHRITTMFGTSSFFRLYTRNSKIHPLMLDSLRLIVAGAEKLQDDVRKDFKLKFNKDILEGYGATETAPVASCNMPDRISPDNWKVQVGCKLGSVGLPLPGTSFRIVDPDTFAQLPIGEAGLLLIAGAQVMQGYLNNPERTALAIHQIDGKRWYATGDKASLDADGFLFIQDRYSRFAKIGGEMVGLGAVEAALKTALDDHELEVVVVNLPDEKKGEKLVALLTRDINQAELREKLSAAGLNPLAFPSCYFKVEEIPKLGSGKTDFATAKKLALSCTQAAG